ncbi:unnamed protein product, partial [Mesorhabditis spiculigera]
MRAGAQAMGFGGINCHVAIESADAPSSKLTPSQDVRTMMRVVSGHRDLAVPLSVAGAAGLFGETLASDLADRALPCRSGGRTSPRSWPNACVQLAVICENSAPASGQVKVVSNEISISNSVRHDIGFLFPGQGSQQPRDGSRAGSSASTSADWVSHPVLSPATVLGSQLTALYAAGAYDQKTLITLAAAKGAAMAVSGGGNGAMASLTCDRSTAEAIIAEAARALAVSNAFHSEMMNEAERELSPLAPVDEQVGFVDVPRGSLRRRGTRTDATGTSRTGHQTGSGPARRGRTRPVLTGLTKAINGTDGVRCFPVASKSGRDEDFNVALAAMKVFIENLAEAKLTVTPAPGTARTGTSGGDPAAALADYLSRRGTFLVDVIRAGFTNGHESVAAKAPSPVSAPVVEEGPAVAGAGSVESEADQDPRRYDGIPAESITTDLRLLDDLNLDSITSLILRHHRIPVLTFQQRVRRSRTCRGILPEVIAEDTGFPVESLDVDLHLLDDLNMDSIKAADAIATVATRLGVQGDLDPAELVNVSLGELIGSARSVREGEVGAGSSRLPGAAGEGKGISADSFTWVRDYTLEKVRSETALHGVRDLTDTTFVVIGDDAGLVGKLESELRGRGAQVDIRTFSDSTTANAHHVVAVMPRVTDDSVTEIGLRRGIEHMYKIVPAQQSGGARTTLAVVQFTDVELSNPAPVPSVAAFAASVHHERPELDARHRIRRLDCGRGGGSHCRLRVGFGCTLCVRDLRRRDGTHGTATAGSRLQRLHRPRKRIGKFGCRGLTGGAKGIMAQSCSGPRSKDRRRTGADRKLSATSGRRNRLHSCGLHVCRFERSLLSLQRHGCRGGGRRRRPDREVEVGPITGFVHGAGANVPRRFERVDSAAAFKEVAPMGPGRSQLRRSAR